MFAKCMTSTNTEDIAEFLEESIKGEIATIVGFVYPHSCIVSICFFLQGIARV